MDRIEDILPQALSGYGLTKRFIIYSIYEHWPDIVGIEIASHSRPLRITGGIMSVNARTAVWSHHLTMMKAELLAKINGFAGNEIVSDIRFFNKGWQESHNQYDGDNQAEPVPLHRLSLDDESRRRVLAIAELARDGELKKRAYRLLETNALLQYSRKQAKWHECASCGSLCPPDAVYCTACLVKKHDDVQQAITDLLWEMPWIAYDECQQFISCSTGEFSRAKTRLIDRLVSKSVDEQDDSIVIATLTMLINRVKPQQLTPLLVSGTLKGLRRKSHVSAYRR